MALNPNLVEPHRSARWRLSRLLLTSLLLGACATTPGHPGAAPHGDLRLDTESAARVRYAGLLRGTGTTSLAVGSTLVLATPVVLAVYHHNQDKVFPCPSSNDPTWRSYGKRSAYEGLTQEQVYQQALDGKVFMLTPRGFF
jgi:hypothetical protein